MPRRSSFLVFNRHRRTRLANLSGKPSPLLEFLALAAACVLISAMAVLIIQRLLRP